ncbi:hypothetical protein BBO_00992 [Beauveria brongniartii RCEF 3172]|uniref:Uncharacterized protein n=1 Tax=Beauveria brongniartii RCEF 3172 TaxID=1081107 RepID=A0A162I1A5_9HYPO|nr:hypothetical protein BBO_00992 [Beauveria brongniartii RCEF 3172]
MGIDFDGSDAVFYIPPPAMDGIDMDMLARKSSDAVKSAIKTWSSVKRLLVLSAIAAQNDQGIVRVTSGRYFHERVHIDEASECYEIAQTLVAAVDNQQSASQLREAIKLRAEIHNHIASAATQNNDADNALHHFLTYNEMLRELNSDTAAPLDSTLASSYLNAGLG